MSSSTRKKGIIASYRNFIHCGVLSCKVNCDRNSLFYEVCQKWFHYKCKKVTKRDYLDIKSRNLTFVCDEKCYNAILPFFLLDQVDFLNVDGTCSFPCKKCKKGCVGNELTFALAKIDHVRFLGPLSSAAPNSTTPCSGLVGCWPSGWTPQIPRDHEPPCKK